MPPLAEGPDCLEPAPIAPWYGRSLEEEAVWPSGPLSHFADEAALPVLPLVYGSVTCPECGRREPYRTMMNRYWKDE